MIKSQEPQMSAQSNPPLTDQTPSPTWEIAKIFPFQGHWSMEEYFALETNRLVEFDNGNVEVLPMPSVLHQQILFFLARLLAEFVDAANLGLILPAPLKVRVSETQFREPDIVFLHKDRADLINEQYLSGADLVIEIVSPDDPKRDLVVKRAEYALAGIQEYWIVEPEAERVTVLVLPEGASSSENAADTQEYLVFGQFENGEIARSQLLEGFQVPVERVFNLD